jgi:hypothetical protein
VLQTAFIEFASSDLLTEFLGPNIGHSPNVKKALFYPSSWGKIPNSVIIKLLAKIFNESFFKLKVEHFHIYDLVTVCFDYASKILRTRYWEPVQYIESLDLLKVECTGL